MCGRGRRKVDVIRSTFCETSDYAIDKVQFTRFFTKTHEDVTKMETIIIVLRDSRKLDDEI